MSTGSVAESINRPLYTGRGSPEPSGTYKGLRRLFDLVKSDASSPRPPKLVWHGMTGNVAEDIKDLRPGEHWHNKAFTSTSFSPAVAHSFAEYGRKTDSIIMEIKPKNKGLDLSAIAGNFEEQEFLIDHGARFRFVGAKEVPMEVRPGSKRITKVTVHQFEEI